MAKNQCLNGHADPSGFAEKGVLRAARSSFMEHQPFKIPPMYCVLDVETPNRNNDRISSIGISVVFQDKIINSFGGLINPEVGFDPFNVHLTGISPANVADAPTFPAMWDKIKPCFENTVLVAHNAPFDLRVLCKTMDAYGIPIPAGGFQYLDTVGLARRALPHLPNHKLDTVCQYYRIPLHHHRADSDSLACAQILLRLFRDPMLQAVCPKYWQWPKSR